MGLNKDKNLERIVNKAMDASKIDQPTLNFTANVMSKIEALEVEKMNHTPIISNQKWVFIIAFVFLFILLSNFLEIEYQVFYIQQFKDLFHFDFSSLNIFSNLKISNIFLYGIFLFGIMFGIQITLIKHFYLKKINN